MKETSVFQVFQELARRSNWSFESGRFLHRQTVADRANQRRAGNRRLRRCRSIDRRCGKPVGVCQSRSYRVCRNRDGGHDWCRPGQSWTVGKSGGKRQWKWAWLMAEEAATVTPGVPKMTIVSAAQDFITDSGKEIKAIRIWPFHPDDEHAKSPQNHRFDRGVVYSRRLRDSGHHPEWSAGEWKCEEWACAWHSDGIISVAMKYKNEWTIKIDSVSSHRTARKIMVGKVYYKG